MSYCTRILRDQVCLIFFNILHTKRISSSQNIKLNQWYEISLCLEFDRSTPLSRSIVSCWSDKLSIIDSNVDKNPFFFFFFLNQLTMVCEINDLSSDGYSPYFVPHLIILTENDRVTFSLWHSRILYNLIARFCDDHWTKSFDRYFGAKRIWST